MGRISMNRHILPALLVLVLIIPTGAGVYRMIEIVREGHWAFDFLPEIVDRLPLFTHAGASILFLLLGALQILPGFRVKHMKWHRRAGRIVFIAGVIGAGSGLWMTLAHRDISSELLFAGRLFASSFWLVALILAVRSIRSKDVTSHMQWMIRAYAITLPAGTLALFLFPMVLILGEDGHEMLFEVVQVAAWFIHLGVAELIIRRKPASAARRPVVCLGKVV